MSEMAMYYTKINDYYISKNAIFYRVLGKLDLAPILKHRLNQLETTDLAVARWDTEQHWLADWKNTSVFEGFYPGCEVAFEINSSTYYKTIKHETTLNSVRNINISSIKLVK